MRAGTARYALLESTHAFAQEATSTREAAALGLRHACWIAQLLRNAEARSDIEGANTRLPPLFAELENIRAALRWCDASDEFALGGEIACRIPELFYWYGFAEEGCSWLERSLEHVREDDHLEVAARLRAGLARLSSDAHTRLSASERAVELAERASDARLRATAYMRYAVALYTLGRLNDALAANDRACEFLRNSATPSNLPFAWALQHRSWMLAELRRFDEARACIEEAIRIFTLRKAEREASGLSGDLAELEFAAGRAERALEIVDEAILVAAETGDPERESVFTCNRAGYLLRLGDFTEAEATARDAVALAHKTHRTERVLHALEHLAAALACRNDLEHAALLAGFVEAGYSSSGYERETTERSSHEILTAALRRAPEVEVGELMRRGAEMTRAQVVELAANCAG
jgi:tetratricopeptide (TPR) repeat protein